MTVNGWLQIGFFLLAILAVTPVLGRFMTRVFTRERTWLDPVLRPLERLIYRSTGVDDTREMRWTEYAVSVLLFGFVSMLTLYLMQRVQQWLPWNPQGFGAVPPALAFNTAASFATNTNWQAYGDETTMSYFTQMVGLAWHNFTSAAVGIALAIAFIRGVAQKEKDTLGNFWVDLVRGLLWVLLPICIVGALLLVSQGVVQNLRPYDKAAVLDPQTVTANGPDGTPQTQVVREQSIAQGPVASQEIIKQFGTNGGGFFNANSADPFENPTPLTNFLEMFGIFAISAGLTYTLGAMTGSPKHGWAVWGAMAFLRELANKDTKLIDIVEIGKQLLMTRGALTTFSIANDVAKYFAIIPAMFAVAFPVLVVLNIMQLKTPESAILSAVIFNALIIVALALRGVSYKAMSAEALLRRNLLIYGVGGLVAPFVGIKIIDVIITTLQLA